MFYVFFYFCVFLKMFFNVVFLLFLKHKRTKWCISRGQIALSVQRNGQKECFLAVLLISILISIDGFFSLEQIL